MPALHKYPNVVFTPCTPVWCPSAFPAEKDLKKVNSRGFWAGTGSQGKTSSSVCQCWAPAGWAVGVTGYLVPASLQLLAKAVLSQIKGGQRHELLLLLCSGQDTLPVLNLEYCFFHFFFPPFFASSCLFVFSAVGIMELEEGFFVGKQHFQAGTQSKQASALGCWLQRCACALCGPLPWGLSSHQGHRIILSW